MLRLAGSEHPGRHSHPGAIHAVPVLLLTPPSSMKSAPVSTSKPPEKEQCDVEARAEDSWDPYPLPKITPSCRETLFKAPCSLITG